MERIVPFAERIHIDLMDGDFAPTKSPPLEHIWWPPGIKADIHLMYRKPMDYLEHLEKIKPNMVIIHAEAEAEHMHFASLLHKAGIETGLAILRGTPVKQIEQIMHSFDQILIFSGKLGYHGGSADLALLSKIDEIRDYHPNAEIAWDGGINEHNARQLIKAGIDVLNVGGAVQKSEKPAVAYATLKALASNRDD